LNFKLKVTAAGEATTPQAERGTEYTLFKGPGYQKMFFHSIKLTHELTPCRGKKWHLQGGATNFSRLFKICKSGSPTG
jgi:hypothetical protein